MNKKYYALVKSYSPGCDYSIGCGRNFWEIPGNPQSMEAARNRMAINMCGDDSLKNSSIKRWIEDEITHGNSDASDFEDWNPYRDSGYDISKAIILEVNDESVLTFEDVKVLVERIAEPIIKAHNLKEEMEREEFERKQLVQLKAKYENV